MKAKRALTTLAATLTVLGGAATAYSPAASATAYVDCFPSTNYSLYWFDCTSGNGTKTIWYINGVRTSEGQGAAYHSFFCTYMRRYTIGVNLGTTLAATWTGVCDGGY